MRRRSSRCSPPQDRRRPAGALPAAALKPGAIRLLAKGLTAAGGRIRPRLRCAGGTSGRKGTLRITVVVKHMTLRLASGSYRIGSSATRTLTLKLSSRAAKLLASHHKGLRAKLTLTPTGGKAKSSTVTIKQKTKRKKR